MEGERTIEMAERVNSLCPQLSAPVQFLELTEGVNGILQVVLWSPCACAHARAHTINT